MWFIDIKVSKVDLTAKYLSVKLHVYNVVLLARLLGKQDKLKTGAQTSVWAG